MNTDSNTNEDQLRAIINVLPEGNKIRYVYKNVLFKCQSSPKIEILTIACWLPDFYVLFECVLYSPIYNVDKLHTMSTLPQCRLYIVSVKQIYKY